MTDDQPPSLMEDALHWLAVLQDGAVSPAERRAFEVWLAASPAHREAWQRAQYVWARLDTLAPALRDARETSGTILTLADRRPSRRRWLQLAAAASVAIAAGGYVLSEPGLFADYATGIAQRRTLRLADGSSIELGSDSALSVSLGSRERLVTLYKGEAFFTVAADAGRPFMVKAAGGSTQALGTAFNIKAVADSVIVTVAEHAVVVAAPAGEQVVLAEGQQVRYGPAGLAAVVAADLPDVLGWRRNRLVFQDAPLGDVVADLQRYCHGRVLIADEGLRRLPVTAVFDAGQAEAAIDTIARTLPIRLRHFSRLLTVITPAT